MSAEVVGLYLAVAHGAPMQAVLTAEAVEGRGLRGCRHTKRPAGGKRQVLLMDERHPPALGLPFGALKENVVIRGLDLEALPLGTQLRIGGALVELSEVCEPCKALEGIRPGLMQESWGRRGQLARVRNGGAIALGDPVELVV